MLLNSNILDHGPDGADNEMCYLIKWKNYTKPQWIRRSGLECAEMLIDYEKKHGLSQSPMSEDDEESIGNEDSKLSQAPSSSSSAPVTRSTHYATESTQPHEKSELESNMQRQV